MRDPIPLQPDVTFQTVNSSVRVNGIVLAYTEWPGEKGPVICLPSLTGHKGSFANIARRLAPNYRLVALDLRGRGDSDKPLEGYGFAYHARDILAFADTLGIESFAVLGHSFGATVGVYLASIRPARVRTLVMMDGGVDPDEEVLEAMRPVVRRLGKIYPTLEAYLDAMRSIPYHKPWGAALERYYREDVQVMQDGSVSSKSSAPAIERDLDLHFHYSMCVHFPTLRCPSLYLRPGLGLLGDRAHILTERSAEAFVASTPGCRRVDIPGVNHYTMVLHDDPPVASPIRQFLDEVLKQS
jgi:pimeloyl-ACP methyl ester carboxylesterase